MRLFEMQKWFGKTIAQPLQPDQTLPLSSKKNAEQWILPSSTLTSGERLEIYHQQYWWRLLKNLQTNFPLLTRLFGYEPFQRKIAIPYLTEHPPTHWALCRLGETLPKWLEKNYQEEDLTLVNIAAHIDWAAQKAFWIGNLPIPPFENCSPEEILTIPITLQLHIHLFSLPGDFFSFRDTFLQHPPEHYNTHPFPPLQSGSFYFVLFRSPKNAVTWQALSEAEYSLLSQFKQPLIEAPECQTQVKQSSTIEKACNELEKIGGKRYKEALEQIPIWFKQWTERKWFGSPFFSA